MKFLIIHTWGMGDMIMFTPVLKALKEDYPNAEIDFLITNKAAVFPIENCSQINRIHTCKHSFVDIVKKAKMLRTNKYDYAFFTSGVTPWKAAIVLNLIGAKHLIGEYRKVKSPFLYNQVKYDYKLHRLYSNEKIVKHLLSTKLEKKPFYCLPSTTEQFTHSFLKKHSLTKNKLFGIHPGCNKTNFYRRWPKEYFVEIIQILQKKHPDMDLILFIGPDELDLGKYIVKHTNIVIAQGLTMHETAGLLSCCTHFLNSDSGLGHVASCYKAELFIIFGTADENITAPVSNRCHILRGKVPPPDRSEWSGLTEVPKCLTEFSPAEVYSKIAKYLSL